jgi:hypothetical protein
MLPGGINMLALIMCGGVASDHIRKRLMESKQLPSSSNWKEALKARLIDAIEEVKKLGVKVEARGGYSTGYNRDNLPPRPVGLFGALALVEGENARSKLGLSFDDTTFLEDGFNGVNTHRIDKKKAYSIVMNEFYILGKEIRLIIAPKKKSKIADMVFEFQQQLGDFHTYLDEHGTPIPTPAPPITTHINIDYWNPPAEHYDIAETDDD